MNIMSIQKESSLRPCLEDNIIGILTWCKDYEALNKFPTTLLNRFAIGIYQIHQGIDWKDSGLNKYESFCAAYLHFMMVGARLGLELEFYIEDMDLKKWPKLSIEQESLHILREISACQQQLIYSSKDNKTKRASRYNATKLTRELSFLCFRMISIVPVVYRQDGIYEASKIMLGLV